MLTGRNASRTSGPSWTDFPPRWPRGLDGRLGVWEMEMGRVDWCIKYEHGRTIPPLSRYYVCLSRLYLNTYEKDFDETWLMCWKLGPLDIIKIS